MFPLNFSFFEMRLLKDSKTRTGFDFKGPQVFRLF